MLSATATAGTIAASSDVADYESLAQQDAFASVGQILGSTGDSAYSGSGVYLGDGWLLTAAHVVDEAASLTFTIEGQSYSAEAWAYHADWDSSDVSGGSDIALVKLTGDVSDSLSVATLYSGSSEVGLTGTSVGYGLTGTGLSGYDTSSTLQKRAGTNVIDSLYGDDILLSDFDSGSPADNYLGSSEPTTMEYLIAPGDSGGGLFTYDEVTATWSLAGINSFVAAQDGIADSDYGDLSGQIRVSVYIDWIDQVITQYLASSTVGSDAVLVIVPEPASAMLIAVVLCFARRSRQPQRV